MSTQAHNDLSDDDVDFTPTNAPAASNKVRHKEIYC
jgi:hypothetical protein